MITTESMIEKTGDWKYSVHVGEAVRDKKRVWEFYYFEGMTDGDLPIAFFNPDNFILEILFGGQHYKNVDLIQGFWEGWFLENYCCPEEYEELTDEEVAKWILDSGLSEEQLFDEIIMEILCELEDAIDFEKAAQYSLESTRKKIKPIIKQQTKEASK